MLRIARILEPARRDRAWLVNCDRCGVTLPGPISRRAAVELDRMPCLLCETTPEMLAEALDEARAWADRN